MKSKVGFVLALVGSILGVVSGIWKVAGYFLARTVFNHAGSMMGGITDLFTKDTEVEGFWGFFWNC